MSSLHLAQKRRRALLARRNQSSSTAVPTTTGLTPPTATTPSPAHLTTTTSHTEPAKEKTSQQPPHKSISSLFNNNDDDDDDDDTNGEFSGENRSLATRKRTTKVTTIASSGSSAPPSKKPSATTIAPSTGKPPSTEESQIARLLKRRKEAGIEDAGEDGLFRGQLAQCADDTNVHMYHSTPVEGFGEAMLRSMGWAGPAAGNDEKTKDDGVDLTPRPDRLGLGAKLSADGSHPPPPSRKRLRINQVGSVLDRNEVQPSHAQVSTSKDNGVVASSSSYSNHRPPE